MDKIHNGEEILPKVSTPEQGARTIQRDVRQMDFRQQISARDVVTFG